MRTMSARVPWISHAVGSSTGGGTFEGEDFRIFMAADTVLDAALDDVDRSLLEVSRTTGMLDPSKLRGSLVALMVTGSNRDG
jgi:hypothetical protein